MAEDLEEKIEILIQEEIMVFNFDIVDMLPSEILPGFGTLDPTKPHVA